MTCPATPERGLTRRAETAWLAALLLYATLLYGWGAGARDMHSSMEASRAVGAQGMMRSGDFMVPRLGHRTYFAKPPLFYWLVSAISLPGGEVTEFTARFASALCGVATVLAAALFARRVFDPLTGLVCGFALATTPVFYEQASVALVNVMLALFTTLALFAAFRVTETERSRWAPAVWCGVALAAGMMTKGPVILLFFAPTLLIYFGFSSKWRLTEDPKRCALHLGGASLMLLAALWLLNLAGEADPAAARWALRAAAAGLYATALAMAVYFGLKGGRRLALDRRWAVALGVLVALSAVWPAILVLRGDFGELWDTIVWELWAQRTTEVGETNVKPVWFYLAGAPLAALPWTIHAVFAFLKGYRDEGEAGRLLTFARVWAIGGVVLFTVISSARQLRYLVPLYPAVALLAGHALTRGARKQLGKKTQRMHDVLARLVVYAMPVAPFAVLGVWLKEAPDQAAMMAVSVGLAVAAAGAGLYLLCIKRSAWAWLFALALGFLSVSLLMNYGINAKRSEERSYRPMSEQVEAAVPAGGTLWIFGDGIRPQALFYLDGRLLAAEPSHESWSRLAPGDAVVLSAADEEAFAKAVGDRFPIEKVLRAERRREEAVVYVVGQAPG